MRLCTDRQERMSPGSVLYAGERPLVVERARRRESDWLVSFEGVKGRDEAERLRGALLEAEPIDDPSALWVHELIGSQVVDGEGTVLGTVESVEANPASDLLVLGSGALVPLCFVVACPAGRIVVEVPPGLIS